MREPVDFAVENGVAVITLNRPRLRNAIDYPTAVALDAALTEFDARDDVRVAVLSGAGGNFCAGMDLKALHATGRRPKLNGRGAFGMVEQPPEKPIIAAIEGYAVGGGLELALACDLIVADCDARLGMPEVRHGMVASGGGMLRLPQRIPHNVALELALTGDPIDGRRAYELGLVNRLSAAGEVQHEAFALATRVAANAPLAVRTTKRVMHESRTWPAEQAFALQEPLAQAVRDSTDAREGARAFAEKREPEWSGR